MLNIQDLRVELESETGLVRAIDGMRLAIERGTIVSFKVSGCKLPPCAHTFHALATAWCAAEVV